MFLSGFFFSKKTYEKKVDFLDKNHGLTPLQNVGFFRLCENFTFEVQKALFSIQNIKECFFLAFLARKKRFEKRSIFWRKPWTNPFAKKRFFSTFWELHFWGPKNFFFYPEYQKMFLYGFLLKKKHIRKRSIFWQKPWTNPFAKCRFFRLCENFTFEVLKALFSIQSIKKCFFLAFFCSKKKI